jgi:hypothetical protein
MVDQVFLTDARRDVLRGESDRTGNSLSVEKSRIRERARLALSELIEVAESEEIDNADVFDPRDVSRLIAALLSGDEQVTPRWNFDGTDAEYRDRYEYPVGLCWRLDHLVRGYSDTLLRTEPPAGEVEEDVDLFE